jgi:predicted membrane protein (TIGR00267 family)
LRLNEDKTPNKGADEDRKVGLIKHIEDELELTERYEVIRRHAAMDIFDGVLPILGILMAGLLVEGFQNDIAFVFETTLLAAIGTSVAHFVGGFSSSFLVESAEGKKLIEDLEKAMPSKYSHSVLVHADRDTTIVVSLLNGIVPSAAILITISPMLVSAAGRIGHLESMLLSFVVGFALLFVLGVFLGRLSRTSIWISVLKTILAGVITILILYVVILVTGAA